MSLPKITKGLFIATASLNRLKFDNIKNVNMKSICCDHTHDHTHSDTDKHECNVDDHNYLCGQCGKLHSKYFIENHYCVCQTLFNIPSKDFEEHVVTNFHTRGPPASNFI